MAGADRDLPALDGRRLPVTTDVRTRGDGSRGGLQGCGKIDRPGQQGFAEDDARDPEVACPPDPIEVRGSAGDEDVDVAPSGQRSDDTFVGCPSAVGEDEPAHASIRELTDDPDDGRWAAALPGKGGEALGSRVKADREPGTGNLESRGETLGIVGDRHRGDDAGRAGSKGEPDPVRRVDATGDLERYRDA